MAAPGPSLVGILLVCVAIAVNSAVLAPKHSAAARPDAQLPVVDTIVPPSHHSDNSASPSIIPLESCQEKADPPCLGDFKSASGLARRYQTQVGLATNDHDSSAAKSATFESSGPQTADGNLPHLEFPVCSVDGEEVDSICSIEATTLMTLEAAAFAASYVPERYLMGEMKLEGKKGLRMESTTDINILRYFIGGQSVKPGKHHATLLFAIEVISRKGGYKFFSALLNAASHTLAIESPNLTLFVVSDAHFPPLIPSAASMVYQIVPWFYPPHLLLSLPPHTLLPTIDPNSSILVTVDPAQSASLSLNLISVDSTPIYADTSLAVYASDYFLDPTMNVLKQHSPPTHFQPTKPISVYIWTRLELILTIVATLIFALSFHWLIEWITNKHVEAALYARDPDFHFQSTAATRSS